MKALFQTLIVAAVLVSPLAAQGRGQNPTLPKPNSPLPLPEIPGPTAPKPAPAAAPKPAAPAEPPRQLVNIRVDLVIIEEGGTAAPVRKTASVITSDRRPAAVRSQGEAERTEPKPVDPRFPNPRRPTYMKADIEPYIERNGLIRTQVVMEYLSPTSQQEGHGTTLRFDPLLESGKPLRVSESTDPTSNRKVIVEVTATILK